MTGEAADLLRVLDERLRAGDFSALGGLLAREFFAHRPAPSEMPANERIGAVASDLKRALPDLVGAFEDIHGDGSEVEATLTLRGTHRDTLWGSPGSGEAIEWTTPVTVRAVGDRLAVRIDGTTTPDRVAIVRKLGLVNPPDEMDEPSRHPVEWPDFVLKLVFTGQTADRPCSHLDRIAVTEATTDECEQCTESGDIWPALRMCLVCGFVGCCDTSKNRHMAEHHAQTGHPIFRSIHRGESWIWCYEDDAFFEGPTLERYR